MDNSFLTTIVKSIEIHNFRCFKEQRTILDAPLVIVEGNNGSGKTTLIEALYFASNIRSCKTSHVDQLIMQSEKAFFLKVSMHSENTIYIGVEHSKKVVKINQKNIKSLKEIHQLLTVISIVDTDMLLIQGGPSERRFFLDEALLFLDGDLASIFKKLKNIVKNRNNFLYKGVSNNTLYDILTEQLVETSSTIQAKRVELLERLSFNVNKLITDFNLPLKQITLKYTPKKNLLDCISQFDLHNYKEIEYINRRSLFGAHLDDFEVFSGSLDMKKHCSRGQQKILLILLKISLVKECNQQDKQVLFLVDDFITDFDQFNIKTIISIFCSLNVQLVFTSPLAGILQAHIPETVKSLTINL